MLDLGYRFRFWDLVELLQSPFSPVVTSGGWRDDLNLKPSTEGVGLQVFFVSFLFTFRDWDWGLNVQMAF